METFYVIALENRSRVSVGNLVMLLLDSGQLHCCLGACNIENGTIIVPPDKRDHMADSPLK